MTDFHRLGKANRDLPQQEALKVIYSALSIPYTVQISCFGQDFVAPDRVLTVTERYHLRDFWDGYHK